MTTRLFLASLLLLLFSTTAPTARTELPAAPVDPGSVLADYVARPDDSFEWWQRSTSSVGNGSEYVELILTSQTWKGIPWHHQLYIIRPADVDADSPHALLMVDGGRWRDPLLQPPESSEPLPDNADLFIEIAEHLRAPVAVLRHVPHQPLFDGLTRAAGFRDQAEILINARAASGPRPTGDRCRQPTRPRSATLAISRIDGGKVGT